jgi:glutamine synthetase
MLLAGLDGIERGLKPGDDRLALQDPGSIPEAERAARGIRRLPTSLDAALDQLEQDVVLLEGLGEPLARAYLAVRRSEARAFSELDRDEEFRLHFARY